MHKSVIYKQENIIRKDSENMSMDMQNAPSKRAIVSELSASLEERIVWYHHMQETQPVRYRPEHNMCEVFRYGDVRQVLLDHATFSIDKSLPEGFPGALGVSDPPQHQQLRSLVSKAFTPRRIQELEPRLTQIADELLAVVIAKGRMNVVTEFTYQLPMRVISEMLGLPPEDQERHRQWSYQLLAQTLGIYNPDNSELLRYFSDLVNERKRDPRDDLISGFLTAEENGAHLRREEIINMCLELMLAGNVTTTMLLGIAVYHFCQHPEIYQALRDDPSLIPVAIEEMLRYHFSAMNVWRTARHDTVLAGHEIKAGQYVVGWMGAANFDETYFPHSEQFDIRRSPNPHLTFGHGIHVCLGYPLARLETRIALERMVAHFSELRMDPEKPVQFIPEMPEVIQSLDILFTRADAQISY
ncbi:MAG: cytochrome P450 [Chloroflexi bacterium]|nr:MAG: cytochrome P450 [Chloroflexota bacterium]